VKTKRKSRRGPTKLAFITTAIAWGWHVQSLASGVFGLALVAVLLVTDIDYAMAFPLTIQIALVATAFTLIGLHGARKHWRSVLVGIAIAIPLTMAAIGGILLTGVLTEPDQPLLESMGLAILVKHKLEGATGMEFPPTRGPTWGQMRLLTDATIRRRRSRGFHGLVQKADSSGQFISKATSPGISPTAWSRFRMRGDRSRSLESIDATCR
jgi:hypothetical protein